MLVICRQRKFRVTKGFQFKFTNMTSNTLNFQGYDFLLFFSLGSLNVYEKAVIFVGFRSFPFNLSVLLWFPCAKNYQRDVLNYRKCVGVQYCMKTVEVIIDPFYYLVPNITLVHSFEVYFAGSDEIVTAYRRVYFRFYSGQPCSVITFTCMQCLIDNKIL